MASQLKLCAPFMTKIPLMTCALVPVSNLSNLSMTESQVLNITSRNNGLVLTKAESHVLLVSTVDDKPVVID